MEFVIHYTHIQVLTPVKHMNKKKIQKVQHNRLHSTLTSQRTRTHMNMKYTKTYEPVVIQFISSLENYL